ARWHGDHAGLNLLNVSATRLHEREEDLQAASDKLGKLLYEARLRVSVAGPSSRRDEIKQRVRELAGCLGHFNSPWTASFHVGHPHRSRRAGPKFLLSCEEVATLFHPPNSTVQVPSLARVESRELAAPRELSESVSRNGAVRFARTAFRSQSDP